MSQFHGLVSSWMHAAICENEIELEATTEAAQIAVDTQGNFWMATALAISLCINIFALLLLYSPEVGAAASQAVQRALEAVICVGQSPKAKSISLDRHLTTGARATGARAITVRALGLSERSMKALLRFVPDARQSLAAAGFLELDQKEKDMIVDGLLHTVRNRTRLLARREDNPGTGEKGGACKCAHDGVGSVEAVDGDGDGGTDHAGVDEAGDYVTVDAGDIE